MSWTLFPVFGLSISEPDAWLDNPLFRDATVVSVQAFRDHLRGSLGDQFNPILGHGKLADAVDVSNGCSSRPADEKQNEFDRLRVGG